ncbi:MAG: PBP1A family penicillin-binding protein [Candidatus Roizmanbacteria bacterium]|nr:MAG: PBP1A family penicillin-binding protein [Candidatus Roizmanbacteria bacterium]
MVKKRKKIKPVNKNFTKIFLIFYKVIYSFILFFIVTGDIVRYPIGKLNLRKIFLTAAIYIIIILKNFILKTADLKNKCKNNFLILFRRLPKKRVKIKLPQFITPLKYFVLGIFFTMSVMVIIQGYAFAKSLPNPKRIGTVNYSLTTHIYDRNKKLLYEIYRDENRTQVKLKELADYVRTAAIAIEDKDFYKHNGISLISGILRSIKDMVISHNLQGGSTLTQQLVKSALLSPERTIQRKIKEIILALWTERLFTKDEILEMYLNQVPYGGLAYGVEEASKTYLKKQAKDLSLAEAALLAGLPQAPSLYSPYTNPEAAKSRRDEVLRKMKEQKFITEIQWRNAISEPISISPPRTMIKAPHFVFYVKQELEDKYGTEQVEKGGLKVTTTLDLDIQNEAEKILREELDKIKNLNVTNGAVLVTRPSTGEILAMVGSADYFAPPSGAFNVSTALRQPGSSIKPLMYSLALDSGFTAASVIDDTPITFASADGQAYSPLNYDGRFHGRIPLRYALANSYNVPAVKVLNAVGVERFITRARNMGINSWEDTSRFGLSLTLGGGEVKMIELANSYAVLANNGFKTNINSILNLENSMGENLYKLRAEMAKVIEQGNAYIISDILSDNVARQWAFGPKSYLEIPGYKVAVKTGTTDSKKDNWTIGYTPDILVAVWVGNNDGSPMDPYLSSGITGAAPIWNRVMNYVLPKYGNKNSWYSRPSNVLEKSCYFGKKEYFLKGTEASVYCGQKILESTNPSTQPPPYN